MRMGVDVHDQGASVKIDRVLEARLIAESICQTT